MSGITALLRRLSLPLALVTAAGCGGDDGPRLEDFLPPIPDPDGTAQSTWAGAVTSANAADELLDGPARSGVAGDFYIRNNKARFIVQSATRVMGTVPWGGNVVDAVLLDDAGQPIVGDSFGELGLMHMGGRTCAHESVEVVRDGAGGGVAVLRARGKTEPNDFINIPGIDLFQVPPEIDPDVDDGLECATTYVLHPDSTDLEVYWTFFNPSGEVVKGPVGTMSDTGGNVETFSPTLGFQLVKDISSIDKLTKPSGGPYQVFQGPGIAYGLVPRRETVDSPNSINNLLGVTIIVFGGTSIFDFLDDTKWELAVPARGGQTVPFDFVVARDAAGIEEFYRTHFEQPLGAVSGTVTYTSNMPGAGARVGVFKDVDGNGTVDPTDEVVTYLDAAADGTFAGKLPVGSYLLRADVKDLARSPAAPVTIGDAAATAALTLPDLGRFEYSVVDDLTGEPIPAKLTVVGRSPVLRDARVNLDWDRLFGVVNTFFSAYGGTAPPTGPADAPLLLPAGGPYRIFVSHGPEWTYVSQSITVTPGQTATLPTFRLRRIVDTAGYVATDFHLHAINSPDSPIPLDDRVKNLAAEGIEFFSSTDHDYVTDYAPVIDSLGLGEWVNSIPGVESTSFVWGHFNAFPLDVDLEHPSHGAPDWGAGEMGYDLTPAQLFAAQRARGAQVVQANHPRQRGLGNFQQYFDRAGLLFDFIDRSFGGSKDSMPIEAKVLRQPEDMAFFDPGFDTIEIWSTFSKGDTNADGWSELTTFDLVIRDWMNFLSLGKFYTPLGNSDSHDVERLPPGMPRSLVWVGAGNDTPAAIAGGLMDQVLASLLGKDSAGDVPRDIVVSNGPVISVRANGQATSAIGRTVTPVGGTVTLEIKVSSADWIPFDTIEIFANNTFDALADGQATSALAPVACYTKRTGLSATDLCAKAPLGGGLALDVKPFSLGNGYTRFEATVTFTMDADDVMMINRAGATGTDAWIAVRATGAGPVFPVLHEGALVEANLDAVVAANNVAAVQAAIGNRGAPSGALTVPVFVDFHGSGYRAPFAP